ncbi:MAG: PHP domain-containing protein, partial [Candidatus Brocadiales bacterium]|nr:PHP domain-containing protein [Candidatus Brocadiales bacterium]
KSLTSYSRYAQGSFVYPLANDNKANFVRSVLDVARSNKVELIIPTTDVTLAVLSEHQEEVETVARLACPKYSSVCLALDKKKTLTLAKSLNIPIPQTEFIENLDSLNEVTEKLGFPIVIKPAMKKFFNDDDGGHNFNIEYITSSESLRERLLYHKKNGSFPMLQEYCKGFGVGIEALMSEGEPLALFQHRRIHEMPVSGGVSVLCESVPVDPILGEYAVKLLRAMNWEGVAMVEFRVDEETNTAKLMEVNGRFWGSLALAIQTGVDFPYLLYELFVNSKKIMVNSYRTNLKCQYRRGDIERLIQIIRNKNDNPFERLPSKKMVIYDFMLSLFDPRVGDLVFSYDDVLPGLVDLKRFFDEVMKKIFVLLLAKKAKRIRGIIHIHSNYSHDGTASIEAIVNEAKKHGYGFVALTEHAENMDENSMAGYIEHCKALQTPELMVIPGLEIPCNNGTHLLAINVQKYITGYSVLEVSKEIKNCGGICIVAHPSANEHNLSTEEIRYIDGMEIWNSRRRSGLTIPNLGAMRHLRRSRNKNKKISLYCGLDLHELREMKSFWIEIPSYCKSKTEFLKALCSGKFFTTNGMLSVSSSGYLSIKGITIRSFLKALTFFGQKAYKKIFAQIYN